MKKKNIKIWIIVGICICIVMGLYAYYLHVSTWKATTRPSRAGVTIFVNQTVTDEGWHLEVNDFWAISNDDCKGRTLVCQFINEKIELSEIKNIPSPGYNITWFDKDNNDYLSIGDVIFISKMGGSMGKASSGDKIYILYTINHNVGICDGKLQ
jgi:hypothetical protein